MATSYQVAFHCPFYENFLFAPIQTNEKLFNEIKWKFHSSKLSKN